MIDLTGKIALVVGIANDHSIAYGCAKAFRDAGATLVVTYLNAKAEKHVRPLAEELGTELFLPLDVSQDDQMDAVFKAIRDTYGRLDICLHAIAFATKEDLHGRVVDSSAAGFAQAMDISCHSFVRMVRLAEPLMQPDGGTCLTVSYYGSVKVVEHYNMMGPVKAALESTTRYLAHELGPQGIRVHTLSPGPMATRAASGIDHFDELLAAAAAEAPTHHLATPKDVGAYAAFLASDHARNVTGSLVYIDGGQNIMA